MSDFETLWNHFKRLNIRPKNGQNAPKKIRNYISLWSCKMRLFEWIWNTVIDFQMFEFSRQKMGKMQFRKSETLSLFEIVKWNFLIDFETLWYWFKWFNFRAQNGQNVRKSENLSLSEIVKWDFLRYFEPLWFCGTWTTCLKIAM